MKQFDVYANPSARAALFAPYVVVLSSHLGDFRAVMVAPLLADLPFAKETVDVTISFDDREMILSLLEMAAIPRAQLKQLAGSVSQHEDAIRRGIGRIFTGF